MPLTGRPATGFLLFPFPCFQPKACRLMAHASFTLTGIHEAAALTKDIARQLPFITSKALNETGKKLQKLVTQKLLPEKFILAGRQRPARGAPWWKPGTALGFNLKFARKTEGEGMNTVLGSRADWLALQETGGTKRAQGGRVAVPEGARKSLYDIVRASRRPRRLMQNRRAFARPLADGREAIFLRTGKNPRDISLMYVLEPEVPIAPILTFEHTTTAEASKIIGQTFSEEFYKAIKSTKPAN